MAHRRPHLVLAAGNAVASSEAAPALRLGGVLGLLSGSGDAPSPLPDNVRAILRKRRARAVTLSASAAGVDAALALAATCAGSALAVASRAKTESLDVDVVVRVVTEVLLEHGAADVNSLAEKARRAFEVTSAAFAAASHAESSSG